MERRGALRFMRTEKRRLRLKGHHNSSGDRQYSHPHHVQTLPESLPPNNNVEPLPVQQRKQQYRNQLSSHEIELNQLPHHQAGQAADKTVLLHRHDGILLYRNLYYREQNMLQRRDDNGSVPRDGKVGRGEGQTDESDKKSYHLKSSSRIKLSKSSSIIKGEMKNGKQKKYSWKLKTTSLRGNS